MKFDTLAIHAGEKPNYEAGGSGDVVVPLHLSTTFARKDVDVPTGGYEYSRSGNPTRLTLEARFAALENAAYGLAFASGLVAETTVLYTLLSPGDHIVAFDDLYGGSARLLNTAAKNWKFEVSYVDARDIEQVRTAIRPNTKLLWMETPTNPLMKLCDIRAVSKLAKAHGIICLVDNTFMSPYFQRPLDLGADISLHSTSKYINGHSDSIGGAIMLRDSKLYERLKFNQNAMGGIMSPFDSYLVLRGLRTLHVRMRSHEQNALTIASYLEKHSRVKKVYYPGLPSFAQHALAKEQMTGFGGMLSFDMDGTGEHAKRFLAALDLFLLAESLGGVESLIELPAAMTHASIAKDRREALGINDGLIRISVGIEHVDDLLADLDQAFEKAFS